ncbi:MAG: hypothetical protein LBR34_11365 [Prevotella sp.]|nr:hypothetical protein [Prevotella sp.]
MSKKRPCSDNVFTRGALLGMKQGFVQKQERCIIGLICRPCNAPNGSKS